MLLVKYAPTLYQILQSAIDRSNMSAFPWICYTRLLEPAYFCPYFCLLAFYQVLCSQWWELITCYSYSKNNRRFFCLDLTCVSPIFIRSYTFVSVPSPLLVEFLKRKRITERSSAPPPMPSTQNSWQVAQRH